MRDSVISQSNYQLLTLIIMNRYLIFTNETRLKICWPAGQQFRFGKKSSRTKCAHKYISDWHTIYFFYTDRLGLDLMLLARWPLCSLRSNIHGLAWSQIWRIPEFSEYLYVLLQVSFDIFSPQKTSYIIRLFKLQRIRNLCKIKKKIGCFPSSREITI